MKKISVKEAYHSNVIGTLEKLKEAGKGKIYYCDISNDYYFLHNNEEYDGNIPKNIAYKDYGYKYSWNIGSTSTLYGDFIVKEYPTTNLKTIKDYYYSGIKRGYLTLSKNGNTRFFGELFKSPTDGIFYFFFNASSSGSKPPEGIVNKEFNASWSLKYSSDYIEDFKPNEFEHIESKNPCVEIPLPMSSIEEFRAIPIKEIKKEEPKFDITVKHPQPIITKKKPKQKSIII